MSRWSLIFRLKFLDSRVNAKLPRDLGIEKPEDNRLYQSMLNHESSRVNGLFILQLKVLESPEDNRFSRSMMNHFECSLSILKYRTFRYLKPVDN